MLNNLVIIQSISTQRLSNLHLIQWSALVVDVNSQTLIRSGNMKGSAVKLVSADRKVGCYQVNEVGARGTSSRGAAGPDESAYTLRDMLNCGREVSVVSSIIFDGSAI